MILSMLASGFPALLSLTNIILLGSNPSVSNKRISCLEVLRMDYGISHIALIFNALLPSWLVSRKE